MKKHMSFLKTAGAALILLFAFISCAGAGESGGSDSSRVINVTSVALNKITLNLSVGEQETLVATVIPSNATNQSVSWSSDDSNVARVINGRVTGVSVGTARITVTTENGGYKANCDVYVEDVAVTGVTLNNTAITLTEGGTYTLIPTIQPANASNKNVSWVSSNPNIASVNGNGLVTAVAQGNATITATTQDGNKTAACYVTVMREADVIRVTGVTLNRTTLTLNQGATETLVATVQPANASNKNVSWVSSNPNIASVNGSGLVTALAQGDAAITVTTSDGGRTAVCAVAVLATTNPGVGDVYVAGYDSIAGGVRPRLWKNGESQNLELTTNLRRGEARSVFVSGSDVYVAGCESNSDNSNSYYYVPTLWKNGLIQHLTTDAISSNSRAYSVFVHGNDVYVAGVLNNYAMLWKNGNAQRLTPSPNTNNAAYAVFVSGDDVYVAGVANNAATLWKNGVSEALLSVSGSRAYSVYVSGNDVYVAGSSGGAALWKNGAFQRLDSGVARSAYVSGSDVYVAGNVPGYSGYLWKNGVRQNLASGISYAYSVYVYGTDVYVAGGSGEETTASVRGARLLKNGQLQVLDVTSAGASYALSVFVK